MNRSIYAGRILGIPIDINYTWFIVFFLVTWTLAQSYFPAALPGYPIVVYWAISLIASVLFFMSLLAHELSHSAIAIKNDLPISGISLFIFGGVAHMTKEPDSAGVEFKMAAAGPACSLVLSLIFYILAEMMAALHLPMLLIATSDYLSFINLAVGVFNLVPGFPLDGGRILRAALWSITGDLKKATGIASTCGKLFAYLLMGLGFVYLFYGLVLSGIWFIFIGFFLQEAASVSYQQIAMKGALSGLPVSEMMSRDVVTVLENMPLNVFVDEYVLRYRYTSFPVLSSSDEIQGIISIHAIKDVPREQWSNKSVCEVMTPVRKDMLISPRDDALEALAQMAGNGMGRLLVVQASKILGIVSQRDIIRLFEVKKELEG